MAISATVVWEVRNGATAANANGGGFKPGASGVDYSQQAAAQYNLTNCTSAAANAIILNASAAADMVGNIAHVISGTNATPGWYEILSVSVGVSLTVDRNWGTGAVASGVVNIGGALSLGSSTANQQDSDFATQLVAGQTVYIKGNVSPATAFSVAAGAAGTPVSVIGYLTTRGDNPTGANRPLITMGTNAFTIGTANVVKHLRFTGSGATVLTSSTNAYSFNVKAQNTSTTAGRSALNGATGSSVHVNGEFQSLRGPAVSFSSSFSLISAYIHSSDIGITSSGSTAGVMISDCLIESCVSKAINQSGVIGGNVIIKNNTLYGAENKLGTGIDIAATCGGVRIFNNIIYGFVTGINDGNAAANWNFGDYNCINNCTTGVVGYVDGPGGITTTPGLSGVAQITGSNGTVSGAVLTSAGANFSTVTDNQDYVNIKSGTSATAGMYLITSHTTTTLTLNANPGDSGVADKVFQITTGRNFKGGANIKQVGMAGAAANTATTNYIDIGLQRDGDTDQPGISDVRAGTAFNNGTKTGTLTGGKSHLGVGRIG